MLHEFTTGECELLKLAVPALGLPSLENPQRRDLFVRAFELDYPDEVVPRGEGSLRAYLQILGAFGPSSTEENLKLISEGART